VEESKIDTWIWNQKKNPDFNCNWLWIRRRRRRTN